MLLTLVKITRTSNNLIPPHGVVFFLLSRGQFHIRDQFALTARALAIRRRVTCLIINGQGRV